MPPAVDGPNPFWAREPYSNRNVNIPLSPSEAIALARLPPLFDPWTPPKKTQRRVSKDTVQNNNAKIPVSPVQGDSAKAKSPAPVDPKPLPEKKHGYPNPFWASETLRMNITKNTQSSTGLANEKGISPLAEDVNALLEKKHGYPNPFWATVPLRENITKNTQASTGLAIDDKGSSPVPDALNSALEKLHGYPNPFWATVPLRKDNRKCSVSPKIETATIPVLEDLQPLPVKTDAICKETQNGYPNLISATERDKKNNAKKPLSPSESIAKARLPALVDPHPLRKKTPGVKKRTEERDRNPVLVAESDDSRASAQSPSQLFAVDNAKPIAPLDSNTPKKKNGGIKKEIDKGKTTSALRKQVPLPKTDSPNRGSANTHKWTNRKPRSPPANTPARPVANPEPVQKKLTDVEASWIFTNTAGHMKHMLDSLSELGDEIDGLVRNETRSTWSDILTGNVVEGLIEKTDEVISSCNGYEKEVKGIGITLKPLIPLTEEEKMNFMKPSSTSTSFKVEAKAPEKAEIPAPAPSSTLVSQFLWGTLEVGLTLLTGYKPRQRRSTFSFYN